MELGEKASYLRFEKGWFCISQFDWKSALMQFEEISIQCMNIHEMEKNSLESIASSKKIPVSTARLIESFIQRAKSSFQPNMKIILPHKCGIALLIACCYQHIGKPLLMDLWFLMTIYLFKVNWFKRGDLCWICWFYILMYLTCFYSGNSKVKIELQSTKI